MSRICGVLLGEGGCAWDRAQSPESLLPYLVEETHEVVEAVLQGDASRITDEAGDALYLWVFFLELLERRRAGSIVEAARGVEEKLVRRHPHVFASEAAPDADVPLTGHGVWERRKRAEHPPDAGALRKLPATLPALYAARRLQEKAAAFGFDWPGPLDVLEKVREEAAEVEEAVRAESGAERIGEEIGDLLFSVVNLSRQLGQDPEIALRHASEKFRLRFNAMARSLEEAGHRLGDAPLDLLEEHWQAAKRDPDRYA
ncbi:MAG: nucleoside triphosphate pyrophosphohydrolase [Candidatus Eisenbacteria bacterium]|nr:nucleoside triphosphate pyrophosphohydrolase [Candidatus Eisenbacteria bacterium]